MRNLRKQNEKINSWGKFVDDGKTILDNFEFPFADEVTNVKEIFKPEAQTLFMFVLLIKIFVTSF